MCIVQANLEQLEILCSPVRMLQPQILCRMLKRDKGNLTSTSSLSGNGNHTKENLLSVQSVPNLLIHTRNSQNTSKRTIWNLDTSVGNAQRLSNLHHGNINTRADTKVFISSAPSKTVANCSNLNINWMTTNGSTPERHSMFVAQGTV